MGRVGREMRGAKTANFYRLDFHDFARMILNGIIEDALKKALMVFYRVSVLIIYLTDVSYSSYFVWKTNVFSVESFSDRNIQVYRFRVFDGFTFVFGWEIATVSRIKIKSIFCPWQCSNNDIGKSDLTKQSRRVSEIRKALQKKNEIVIKIKTMKN